MPLYRSRLLSVFLVFTATSVHLPAQSTTQPPSPPAAAPDKKPDRKQAIDLFNSGKFVDAMPLFEKLAADYDQDITIKEDWAFSIMAYATTLPDANLRKKARVRARSIALQARKLGDNSPMVQLLLQIPEDGSEPTFSDRQEVDDAMKAAEADFSRGEFDKARDGYLHVLLLEPKNYEATLFIGDVYFKQHANGNACSWFGRAAQIDANREPAFRYWGDAMLAMGNIPGARDKYMNAFIAEPYKPLSSAGLIQWARQAKVTLNWIRIQDKAKVVATDNGPRLTLDTSLHAEDPMFKPWIAYAEARLQWQKEKFKQQFPDEKKYRHSLAEEVEALHLMAVALSQSEVASTLEAPFAALLKIDQAGLLEPFALLNRADTEIVLDYAPYRAAHRDTLYRYLDDFVVPKSPQP